MNDWGKLLHEVRTLEGCPITKRRVLSVLRTMDGRRVRCSSRALTYAERVKAAVGMIKNGMARNEARDALMQRFGVSRESSYMLLRDALDAMQPGKQRGLFDNDE